jgi:Holliday junction resolvase
MRRAARIDLNHGEVVDALRKVGVSVVSLASVGNGIPDLLAAKNDKVWLIEVKGPKGKLTPAQVEFMATWPGVVHIVRSVDDALRLVGVQA